MNAWERWGKRLLKGLFWVTVFVPLATVLDLEITWRLLVLVSVIGVWGGVLDEALPTHGPAKPVDSASSG